MSASAPCLAGLIQAQASAVDLATTEPVWGDTALRENRPPRTRPPGTGIHAHPARPACRRRATERRPTWRNAGRGRRYRPGRARAPRWPARDRLARSPASCAHSTGVTFIPHLGGDLSAHDRRIADRAQPARLRSLQAAQRVRRAGWRTPGAATAGTPRSRRQRIASYGRDGAVGDRQPQDRRRSNRASARVDGRGTALRQLRAALRRDAH